jgi:hypothetical protein
VVGVGGGGRAARLQAVLFLGLSACAVVTDMPKTS